MEINKFFLKSWKVRVTWGRKGVWKKQTGEWGQKARGLLWTRNLTFWESVSLTFNTHPTYNYWHPTVGRGPMKALGLGKDFLAKTVHRINISMNWISSHLLCISSLLLEELTVKWTCYVSGDWGRRSREGLPGQMKLNLSWEDEEDSSRKLEEETRQKGVRGSHSMH